MSAQDGGKIYLLPAGTILKNRYRIDGVLGEGGFGITYRGTGVRLGLKVAIKEYYPCAHAVRDAALSSDVQAKPDKESQRIFESHKAKFLDEAQKLAQCSVIPSVVGAHEHFEENHTAYIVMEYLDGVTLKSELEAGGPMKAEWLCRLMQPLMRDLDRVHQLGVLHRDISPDNIMLMPDGRLKLMDFGAARDYSEETPKSMSVILKHGFAPYGQYTRHGKQGPWTDVYALSATIYACITGLVPDSATDRQLEDMVQRPSELGVKIKPALEAAILKGMNLRREDRYQSAMEMADALKAAIESTGQRISNEIGDNEADGQEPEVPLPVPKRRKGAGNTIIDQDEAHTSEKLVPPEEPKEPEKPEEPKEPEEPVQAEQQTARRPGRRFPRRALLVSGAAAVCLMRWRSARLRAWGGPCGTLRRCLGCCRRARRRLSRR